MKESILTKSKVIALGLKLFFSVAIPGTISVLLIYIYSWNYDIHLLNKYLTQTLRQYSVFALFSAVLGLGLCVILILRKIIILLRRLFLYIDEKLSNKEVFILKKELINIVPGSLLIIALTWLIINIIIFIIFYTVSRELILLLRTTILSTLVGVSLTTIPAYLALDTIIKKFIRNYFNKFELKDYSGIKNISIALKIFSVFIIGGVLPTLIIYFSSYDIREILRLGDTVSVVDIKRFTIVSVTALIISVVIPLVSALYFYFTIANPLKDLYQTIEDVDGGNLNLELKPDFTDEIGLINMGLNNMISRVRDSVKLHEEFALIEKELDIAENVQNSVLTQPGEYEGLSEYDIAVLYKPQNGRVGGDYFNIINADEDCTSVFLADATGHGMQAALTTMQIDMMNRQSIYLVDPGERFKFLNEYYTSEIKGSNLFTACCVNLYSDHVTYGGAGHPQQYIFRANGDVTTVENTGKLIGAFPGLEFSSNDYSIENGDVIVIFTDGAFEQYNDSREMFGEDELFKTISNYMIPDRNLNLTHFNQNIYDTILKFTGELGLDDDITIISMKRR